MALTGTIEEVNKVDGTLMVRATVKAGQEYTISLGQLGGADFYPLKGDMVTFDKAGNEWVAYAVFQKEAETAAGEWLAFSRNGQGEVVASFHLKNTGEVDVRSTGVFRVNGHLEVDP